MFKVAGTDADFWDRELKEPALLYSLGHGRLEPSHVERQQEQAGAGLGKKALKRKRAQEAAAAKRHPPPPPPQHGGQQKKGAKAKGKGAEDWPHPRKGRGNTYLSTRDGSEVCFAWNRDPNGCSQGPCPHGRAHVCEKCLQPHRGCGCNHGGGGKGAPHM